MASIMRRNAGALGRFAGGESPWLALRDRMSGDPFQELSQLLPMGERLEGFVPDFDVRETDRAYVFTADLPGLREQDVDISLSGNRLMVSGARQPEPEQPSDTAYLCERAYGAFTRTFTLPGDIDADRVRAELRDGVLRLEVAKAASAEPRRIPVAGDEPVATSARPSNSGSNPEPPSEDGDEADEILEPP